jgi:hypothetical protein
MSLRAEMGAQAHDCCTPSTPPLRALCDRLPGLDTEAGHPSPKAAWWHLSPASAKASRPGRGFYSAGEFDLSPLMAPGSRPGGELLELGRGAPLSRGPAH